MKHIATLPEADWTMISFKGDIVFVCDKYPPVIFNPENLALHELLPDRVSFVSNAESKETEEAIPPASIPPKDDSTPSPGSMETQ